MATYSSILAWRIPCIKEPGGLQFIRSHRVGHDWSNLEHMWIKTNCGQFFKRWEYQTSLLVSWEICMQGKKQQVEPDMEQWTGSKSGKMSRLLSPRLFNFYAESIMWMAGWMKHKLESSLPGEISITSDMQMITLKECEEIPQVHAQRSPARW